MKQWIFAASLALATLTAAPAQADDYYAVTPSGRAEAFFDMPVVETADLLTNKCIDLAWTVISSTSTVITCEAPMNLGQSILSALLIGNQYSTTPQMYYRFNLAGSGPSTRVQVNGWIETQMAFGQVRREELSGASFHNSVMSFFEAAGGRWPPGTEFPNHVFIGLHSDVVEVPEKGLRITAVEPGGPGERAGLQVGDVMTRIAGERVKDGDDLIDALEEAREDDSYEIEYYRVGKKARVTLAREFRAAIVAPELPYPIAEPEQEFAHSAPVVAPVVSIADELAKFAQLRDEGVISAEEFEAQKVKLLAN